MHISKFVLSRTSLRKQNLFHLKPNFCNLHTLLIISTFADFHSHIPSYVGTRLKTARIIRNLNNNEEEYTIVCTRKSCKTCKTSDYLTVRKATNCEKKRYPYQILYNKQVLTKKMKLSRYEIPISQKFVKIFEFSNQLHCPFASLEFLKLRSVPSSRIIKMSILCTFPSTELINHDVS